MIRAVVVDDEAPSREVLCNYLRDFCNDVEVVATASSVKSAHRVIQKYNPDVVFLDIEMPDGKGFDLLKMFGKINFRVIFVTAYSEYAIKAFRVNAADYLLKPVKIDELSAAVDKIRNENRWSYDNEKVSELLQSLSENMSFQPTIVVSNIKGFEVLKISEIIMCKADGYCTNLYLEGDRKIISSKNLKQYEDLLVEHNIIRVHHSYLVNLSHIQSFTRQGEIILSENLKASLGDSFRNAFIGKFNKK
ncbi:MAG: LytTR family DNA-binding domain-containing protein [Bacteroidia bacterium]|nr:LytTR family DNA-binding domain-containing protein [Bacteroidia bacterium]